MVQIGGKKVSFRRERTVTIGDVEVRVVGFGHGLLAEIQDVCGPGPAPMVPETRADGRQVFRADGSPKMRADENDAEYKRAVSRSELMTQYAVLYHTLALGGAEFECDAAAPDPRAVRDVSFYELVRREMDDSGFSSADMYLLFSACAEVLYLRVEHIEKGGDDFLSTPTAGETPLPVE